MDAKLTIISQNIGQPGSYVGDWSGEWSRAEVLQEMKDVGIELDNPDKQWIDYVFDNVFDCPGLMSMNKVIECIKISNALKMKFKIKDVMVSIDYNVIEK